MPEEFKKTRLRPIVYSDNRAFKRGEKNTALQMELLKALQITQDPKKLRDMLDMKTVAEVYRTMDKLAMRKEYHSALAKKGISFEFIVGGIKNIAEKAYKDGDKLKAYQTLLKSVGMDTYKEAEGGSSGTWEEELLKRIDAAKAETGPQLEAPPVYAVILPPVPESVKKNRDEEREMTSSIYDTKPANRN